VLLSYVSVEQPNSKARVVALLSTLNNSSEAPRVLALWDGVPKTTGSSADALTQPVRTSAKNFHTSTHCIFVSIGGTVLLEAMACVWGQLGVCSALMCATCHQLTKRIAHLH